MIFIVVIIIIIAIVNMLIVMVILRMLLLQEKCGSCLQQGLSARRNHLIALIQYLLIVMLVQLNIIMFAMYCNGNRLQFNSNQFNVDVVRRRDVYHTNAAC